MVIWFFSICTCSKLSLDYRPGSVSVSRDAIVITRHDDYCLHIYIRDGSSVQEMHTVTSPKPQGRWWLIGVHLAGPQYAVLDGVDPGACGVCGQGWSVTTHQIYNQATSPGYQHLNHAVYMIAEQSQGLLIADRGNHSVQLVSGSGTFLQHVVTREDDGVWLPWRLSQEEDSGLLVVGHWKSEDTDSKDHNTAIPTVSVFKYQPSDSQ